MDANNFWRVSVKISIATVHCCKVVNTEDMRRLKIDDTWMIYRSSRLGRAVFFRKSLSYGHGWLLFPVGKETNKPENQLARDEGETVTKKQMHAGESPARKKE